VFTIDASVWINAESPAEPGQPESRALLDLLIARNTSIIVPSLLAAEVAGAVARTRGDSVLAEAMAMAIIRLPNVRLAMLDNALARQAAELAARNRLRGADAVYAATALAYGSELISLDHEHLPRLVAVVPTSRPVEALRRLSAAGAP
jgi:predicted nucleic acid-binding protein